MRLYVAFTDRDWFALHASKPEVEEVNFWRPSPDARFKALQPGELLLFKLHSPDNFIAGGGFFTRFLQLPLSLYGTHSERLTACDHNPKCGTELRTTDPPPFHPTQILRFPTSLLRRP